MIIHVVFFQFFVLKNVKNIFSFKVLWSTLQDRQKSTLLNTIYEIFYWNYKCLNSKATEGDSKKNLSPS